MYVKLPGQKWNCKNQKNFTDSEENKINKRRKYCPYMKDKIKLEALLLLQVSELSLQKWKELICKNDTYHWKLTISTYVPLYILYAD